MMSWCGCNNWTFHVETIQCNISQESCNNDESHQLDVEEMNEGTKVSVSNLVTHLLNLGCKDLHSHHGAEKFLSYITGEQFEHIRRSNAVKNNSLNPKLPMQPTTKITPIPWNTPVVTRTLGLLEVSTLKSTSPTSPKVGHILTMTTSPKSPKVAQSSLPSNYSHPDDVYRSSILHYLLHMRIHWLQYTNMHNKGLCRDLSNVLTHSLTQRHHLHNWKHHDN